MGLGVPLSRAPLVRGMASFLRQRLWLFIAFLVGAALYMLPVPDGLTREGQLILIMVIVAVILFVSEPVPLPAVALMIIAGQVILLNKQSSEVARSLMSDSVLFIMGSLMLAVGIIKQKLDKRLAYLIVRATGTGLFQISAGISIVCGVLSSVIGGHTVAAMMLPVALTLITLTKEHTKNISGLSAVLLLSIAYGCAIGSIGTPSGGARNAIMIGYWREFFYEPGEPMTLKYLVSYLDWMKFAYPVFLLQLPFVTWVLFAAFKPEHKTLRRAVAKLRKQIEAQGPIKGSDWAAIFIFLLTLAGWVTLSDALGLGIVAILGSALFLIVGLVRWNDMNSGVNWGVVLIYAATISLGVEMKDSGAAEWLAVSFLDLLKPLHMDHGLPLWAAYTALTTLVANTMSAGAAVAVLGPVTLHTAELVGESPLELGYITAISTSFAYFTAAAQPAFAIVYASGYLRTRDFLKVGWRMGILSAGILLLAAKFYWPLLGV
jgi:solute carrier family 13 (sodium-dependent dicarboxylate transporter), member 2/3/5